MTRSTSKQPFWCTGATVVSRGKRLRRLRALFSLEPRAAKAASWGLVSPCRGAVIAIAMFGKDVLFFFSSGSRSKSKLTVEVEV